MEQTRFTLRVHPLIMRKLKVIADNNGRSVNKEIEQILKWVVDDFENKCGKIKLEDIEKAEKAAPLEDFPDRPMDMLFKL